MASKHASRTFFQLLFGVIFLLLLIQCTSFAAWIPQGSAAAGGARHIVLNYISAEPGAPSNMDVMFYRYYVGYIDTSDICVDTIFDTFLVLPIVNMYNGRTWGDVSNPTILSDWTNFLDQAFLPNYQLDALDLTTYYVNQHFGRPGKVKVILMIPYPSKLVSNFGILPGGTRSLNFANKKTGEADRRAAVQWYVNEALARWQAKNYQWLELVGFYWFEERATSKDTSLIQYTASLIHNNGYKFFWIPWYLATGYSQWQTLGFDCAMMQPNYTWDSSLGLDQAGDRLIPAANITSQYGMGLEMEMHWTLTDPVLRGKYLAYLDYGYTLGYINQSVLSYYLDITAFKDAAISTDPNIRYLYDRTYRFVHNLPPD